MQVLRALLVTEVMQGYVLYWGIIPGVWDEREEEPMKERGVEFSKSHAHTPVRPTATGKIQVLRSLMVTEVCMRV